MEPGSPRLSRDEVRAFDRRATEELGLPAIVLMENAGRSAAEAILALLRTLANPGARRAVVLCGAGNNGGDGYVVARHLSIAGISVEVASAVPASAVRGDAAVNLRAAQALGIPLQALATAADVARAAPCWEGADALVDALLGTGFRGEVRSPILELIQAANSARVARRVAIDLPSGLDCDSGRPSNATFRADLTVTFVARKLGFDAPGAAAWTGEVVVAGIGVPFPSPPRGR